MSAIKPSTSIKKTNTKHRKRKREKETPEERYHKECIERYNKLKHASSKLLHKEGKIVKSFECQKIVRAMKTANETLNEMEKSNKTEAKDIDKAKKKVATLEQKLKRTKQLELDMLVSVGMKRLGVLSLDPRLKFEDADDGGDDGDQIDNASESEIVPQDEDPFYTTLIESMLRHKRLSSVMDQINEKVSDYQSWTTYRKEAILNDDLEPKKGKKKKQRLSKGQNDTVIVAGGQKRGKIDMGGHEGTSGLFIGSLSGQKIEGYIEDEVEGEYDVYNDDELYEKKKKNRPGQRARKAKAMAVEARKKGETWDSSVNWREKKSATDQPIRGQRKCGYGDEANKGGQGRHDAITKAAPVKSQDIATMGKSWKEEGKAHPSWAAKTAQKTQGIVEFKGTKITF